MTNEQIQIEALLKEKIGLKKDSISSRKIALALETRRRRCDLPDLASYLRYLQTCPQEWYSLIEQIVVPETWFFRHREAFKFLFHYIKTEWLKNQPLSTLKVLSLPCSTGEEPYSIAMTLLEVGLTQEQFQIDALDISDRALQKAKKGVYGEHSFREELPLEKSRYFEQALQHYQISPLVRETVQFKVGNILDLNLPTYKHYHIIFCRHLLIYLDLSARSHAIDVLEKLLTPRGFLFVGSPEISLLKAPRFQVVDYPYAFVYQKGESLPKYGNKKADNYISETRVSHSSSKLVSDPSKKNKNQNKILLKKPAKTTPLSTTNNGDQFANNQPITPNNPLEEAKHLADSGELDKAAFLCRIYLNQAQSDSQAYLLLGQIYQAKGDEQQAERYFQKVVYLDPNCEEALMHLALLKESRGDLSGATLIRQRIQRLFKLKNDLL